MTDLAPTKDFTVNELVALKQQMNDSLSRSYKQLIEFSNSLPINPNMRIRAQAHFDDGILWLQEALRVAEIKPAPIPTNAQPIVPEPKKPRGKRKAQLKLVKKRK